MMQLSALHLRNVKKMTTRPGKSGATVFERTRTNPAFERILRPGKSCATVVERARLSSAAHP
jgi:hypothetical protein